MFDAILNNEISLAVSSEIISEYEEVLNTFFESDQIGEHVTKLILNLPNTIRKDVYYKWGLISKDPDDNKFVDCAVAVNADFVITDDTHFKKNGFRNKVKKLVLHQFPN